MTPPSNGAGALAQRLAALLCFTGAGLFGLAAALVSRLERVPGTALYRLPGGAALDPTAVTVLLACAGLLALLGVLAFLVVPRRAPIMRRGSMRRRPVVVLLVGLAALLAVLAVRRFGF